MPGEKLQVTQVTFDMDGVFVPGPVPTETLRKLVCANFRISPEEYVLGYYPEPRTLLRRAWAAYDYYSHSRRQVTDESVKAVERLVILRKELGLDLQIGILTGRDPAKHDLSRRVLERGGVMPDVSNMLLFNGGGKSALWKEMNARGKGHFHFEDDLEPSLRMAAKGTVVYMLSNLSNRDWLLRRNGITLPPNVVRVANITEGMNDLEQRLKKSSIS